ncbi:hypothetical protein Btru_073544 [Bulinus truncatus]|nr:hypothetical protein Btru_073544 [Bulinus truncatus]
MYLKNTDSASLRCGASTDLSANIVFGDTYQLTVTANLLAVDFIPQLRYKSDDTKRLLHQSAKIECVFTGYEKTQPLPLITWALDDGTVIQNSSKYEVSADGRSLIINNLLEIDERHYYCKAKNGAGETLPHGVFLNVTSPPMFLVNKSPRDITVSQGKDVTIPCEVRSALNERLPSLVTWLINGVQTDANIDRSKFDIQPGSLTIKSVRKPDDIMCVQCVTTNSEGELMGEACVNVLLPITVTRQPPLQQEISMGGTLDLTVRAISDISMILKYSWVHYRNNVTTVAEIPKFTYYDQLTDEAYINTDGMSEADYRSVGGTYRLNISHPYDYHIVEVHVTLRPGPDPKAPVCDTCSGADGLYHHTLVFTLTSMLLVTLLSR